MLLEVDVLLLMDVELDVLEELLALVEDVDVEERLLVL